VNVLLYAADFFQEALTNIGVCVKGKILQDPGSESSAQSQVDQTITPDRPHLKQW